MNHLNFFFPTLISIILLILKRSLKSIHNLIVPSEMLEIKQGKKSTQKVLKNQMKIVYDLINSQIGQFHQILQAQQNFDKFSKLKFFKQICQQKNIEEQLKKYSTLSKKAIKPPQKKIIQIFFKRTQQEINSIQDFIDFINNVLKEQDDQIEIDSKSSLKTDKSSSIMMNSQNGSSRIDLIDLTGDFDQDLNKIQKNSNYYDKSDIENRRSSQDIQQEKIENQKQFFQQLKKQEIEQLTEQEKLYEKRMTLPSNLNKLNLGLKLDPIIELPIQENQRNLLISKDTYMNRSDRSKKSINLFAPSNKNSTTLLNSQILKKDQTKKGIRDSKKNIKQKGKKFFSVRGKSANVKKKDNKPKMKHKKVVKNKKGSDAKDKSKIEKSPKSQVRKSQKLTKLSQQNDKKLSLKNQNINNKNQLLKKQSSKPKRKYKKFISQSLDNLMKSQDLIKTFSCRKLKLQISKETLIQFHNELQKTYALDDLMKSTALPKQKYKKKQSDEFKNIQASFQMNEFVRDTSLNSIEISKIEKLNFLKPLNSQVLEQSDLNLNLMNLIQGDHTSPVSKNELKSHVVKLSQFKPKEQEVNKVLSNQTQNQTQKKVDQNFEKFKLKTQERKQKKFISHKQNNRKSKLQLLLNKSFNVSDKDCSIEINRNDLNNNKFFKTYNNDQKYQNQSYQIGHNKYQNLQPQNNNVSFDIKNYYQNKKSQKIQDRNRRVSRISRSFVGSQLDNSQYTILLKDNEDLTKKLIQGINDQKNQQKLNQPSFVEQKNEFTNQFKKDLIIPLHRSRINSFDQRHVQKAPLKCKSLFKKLILYCLQIDNIKNKLQKQTNFDTQSLFNFYKTNQNYWNVNSFSNFVKDLGLNIQDTYLKNLCQYLNFNNNYSEDNIYMDQFVKLFENIRDDKVSVIRNFYAQNDQKTWNIRLLNRDTHKLITDLLKLNIKKIYDITKKIGVFTSNEIVYSFQRISDKKICIEWEQFVKFMGAQNLDLHPGDNFYIFYEINGCLSRTITKEAYIKFFKSFKNLQF